MSTFLEARDPRGIKIYCSENQWNQHIITTPTGHPKMKDNVDAVVQTITAPDYIFESHDSDASDYREVYCKEVQSATYYSNAHYTKVVASVCGGSGEVITAYDSKNITGGAKGEAKYRAKDRD